MLVVVVPPMLGACSSDDPGPVAERPRGSSSTPAPVTSGPTDPTSATVGSEGKRPLRVATALDAIEHLAGSIGPRHATSPAFARAARWLDHRLRQAGYAVRLQEFPVPGGTSWGVPVSAGRSVNVVATPRGFDARRPHLVVGAHLDTVPQSPGAEDDASGIGVLLMVADVLSGRRSTSRLPVVFVGFGGEEPRGPTDADHHYGSRAYVSAMRPAERRAVRGMLALDRVGVGDVVPVCTAGDGAAQAEVLRAARRSRIPVERCENTSSDHASFVEQGMPGVRVGGTSYAAYHSPADLPSVVDRAQLRRTARLVLAWLR
jgi:aminopeptidase YwaD